MTKVETMNGRGGWRYVAAKLEDSICRSLVIPDATEAGRNDAFAARLEVLDHLEQCARNSNSLVMSR